MLSGVLEMAVTEHRGLRLAGGAAGEDQDGDVVGQPVDRGCMTGVGLVELPTEVVTRHQLDTVERSNPLDHAILHDHG
jgi:hypothetical protein